MDFAALARPRVRLYPSFRLCAWSFWAPVHVHILTNLILIKQHLSFFHKGFSRRSATEVIRNRYKMAMNLDYTLPTGREKIGRIWFLLRWTIWPILHMAQCRDSIWDSPQRAYFYNLLILRSVWAKWILKIRYKYNTMIIYYDFKFPQIFYLTRMGSRDFLDACVLIPKTWYIIVDFTTMAILYSVKCTREMPQF